MIRFQLGDGSQYVANVIFYDIEIKDDRVEVYIGTDRGKVCYELRPTNDDRKEFIYMRNNIADGLDKNYCLIKEDPNNSVVTLGNCAYKGNRVKSDFFPRKEE